MLFKDHIRSQIIDREKESINLEIDYSNGFITKQEFEYLKSASAEKTQVLNMHKYMIKVLNFNYLN